MRTRKSKIQISIIILTILLLLCSFSSTVFGRDNYAIGIATIEDNGQFLLDTRESVSEAITAYQKAGYRVYGVGNPGKQHLREQLYADVQFFNCHGNQECVVTAISGIVVGSDRMYGNKDCIGTNSVHWDADTILVIYAACQGAGNDGINNPNSVARKTAERGADVVMAWRSSVETTSLRAWTRNYNNALANGYTVIKAMDYANSFSYSDSRVPQNSTIIHHGDTSIKIGKYRSANSDEIRPEDNLLLKSKSRSSVKIDEGNLENIYSIIKDTYPEFDEKNYVITKGNAQSINQNNGEIEETEYINFKFKVGEFETTSGFTIKARNNIVEAIYDNTVDFNKEMNILNQENSLRTRSTNENDIELLKNEAINELLEKYNNCVEVNPEDVTYKYLYDIDTDKKYVEFTIRNTIGDNSTNEVAEAYDTVKFEI